MAKKGASARRDFIPLLGENRFLESRLEDSGGLKVPKGYVFSNFRILALRYALRGCVVGWLPKSVDQARLREMYRLLYWRRRQVAEELGAFGWLPMHQNANRIIRCGPTEVYLTYGRRNWCCQRHWCPFCWSRWYAGNLYTMVEAMHDARVDASKWRWIEGVNRWPCENLTNDFTKLTATLRNLRRRCGKAVRRSFSLGFQLWAAYPEDQMHWVIEQRYMALSTTAVATGPGLPRPLVAAQTFRCHGKMQHRDLSLLVGRVCSYPVSFLTGNQEQMAAYLNAMADGPRVRMGEFFGHWRSVPTSAIALRDLATTLNQRYL